MHRDIMAFPSQWFYHGQLKAAPQVADRLVSPLDTPLTWVDTSLCGFGEKQNRLLSRSNAEEARLLIHLLRDYIEMIGLTRIQDDRVDFGIISPYRAQVRLIRRLLKWQKFFRTLRRHISVNTVVGFQGQERDVIVISMVRDNDQGTIGFLNDLRRMNVAITRARMKLIILGDASTMTRHPFYKKLYEYIDAL
jgi:superfamily I DNA and/or RNA helicase